MNSLVGGEDQVRHLLVFNNENTTEAKFLFNVICQRNIKGVERKDKLASTGKVSAAV